MSLVYAGICCHAPGITNRPEKANPEDLRSLRQEFAKLREEIETSQPDVLFVVSAEHYANFFNNNMPTFSIGMAEDYEGPIEDPEWLGIGRTRIPGNRDLSRRLIELVMEEVDVSFAEEWKFDHGIMVPLAHLTPQFDFPVIPANINCQSPPLSPLRRSYAFGKALRRAFDAVPERIALIGTGGTSHWPCTPDTGKINAAWDDAFLQRWAAQDVTAMTSYRDEDILAIAGHGGFEIRTSITVAGAAGGKGDVRFYKPIPVFSCGCLIASMAIA
jgi:2,3-dihydroxyphenylpropionate 1,2-dioxygenase